MPTLTVIYYAVASIFLLILVIALIYINITLTSVLETLAKEATTQADKDEHDSLSTTINVIWGIIIIAVILLVISIVALIMQVIMNRPGYTGFMSSPTEWLAFNMYNETTKAPYTAYIPEKSGMLVTTNKPPPSTQKSIKAPGIIPAGPGMQIQEFFDATGAVHKRLVPNGTPMPQNFSGVGGTAGGATSGCHNPNDLNAIKRELQVGEAQRIRLAGGVINPDEIQVDVKSNPLLPTLVRANVNVAPNERFHSVGGLEGLTPQQLAMYKNNTLGPVSEMPATFIAGPGLDDPLALQAQINSQKSLTAANVAERFLNRPNITSGTTAGLINPGGTTSTAFPTAATRGTTTAPVSTGQYPANLQQILLANPE